MTTLSERLLRLRHRRTDPVSRKLVVAEAREFEKIAKSLPESPQAARHYVDESATEVPHAYTARSYASAERVKAVIDTFLANDISVEFELQGSVTNNTHIKIHSDIDLLVLTKTFITVAPPLKVVRPYTGSPIAELVTLRDCCEAALLLDTELTVNSHGPKALAVHGEAITCKVDIVAANWYDTLQYRLKKDKKHRGVLVLDKRSGKRITNFPFLHNANINERDRALAGMLRPAIRLIKSIRFDSSEAMKMSSFDIAGLCYRMPDDLWPDRPDNKQILWRFLQFCKRILEDDTLATTLTVPNDQRCIFGPDGTDRQSLVALAAQILTIFRML